MIHVAILQPLYLEAILDGRKTIEMRLTRTNRVPYEAVEVGERVYFKQSGGPFRGSGVADHVLFLGDLTPRDLARIRRDYNEWIGADAAFWQSRRDCRFCSLIWVRQVEAVRFGPRMQPHHGVAWQCLPESADVYPRCVAPREGGAKPQAVQGGESRRITAPEARDAGASNGAMLIPLTEGNIRHGHIYLTRHIGRFPPDALGGATQAEAGRPLRLHIEGDQVVETDIVKSRRIFRSRAWRAWFARQRARAGDRVRLEPKGPRDFRVTLVRGSARD